MSKPPITDSPWLWFAIFPAFGLGMLLITGGKFGERQAGIERQGQARSALAEGKLEVNENVAGRKEAEGVPNYSSPGDTQVSLGPLEITLGVLTLVSLGLLVRERLLVEETDREVILIDKEV